MHNDIHVYFSTLTIFLSNCVMKNIIWNTSEIRCQRRNTGELERVGEGHKAIRIGCTTFGSKHNFYWIWPCRPTAHSTDNLCGSGGFGGTLYATNCNIVIGEDGVKICPSDGDITSCCGCNVKLKKIQSNIYSNVKLKQIHCIIELCKKWTHIKICYLCFIYICKVYTNVSSVKTFVWP